MASNPEDILEEKVPGIGELLTPPQTQPQTGFFDPAPPVPLEERPIMPLAFELDTALGSLTVGGRPSRDTSTAEAEAFDFRDHIPPGFGQFQAKYAQDKTAEEISETTAAITREMESKQYMSEHPWTTFFAGIPPQFIDPPNWIPGGVVFTNSMRAYNIAKSVGTAAAAGVASAGIQEVILHPRQLTRTEEESAWNIAIAGAFSGLLGGVGATWSSRASAAAKSKSDFIDIVTDKPLETDPSGVPTDTRIANAPEMVQRAVTTSGKYRLATDNVSPSARLASQQIFEFSAITEGNLKGEASAQGVEALNYTDMGRMRQHLVEGQDAVMDYYGVSKNPWVPFAPERIKKSEGMPIEELNATVSAHIFNATTDANPKVNAITDSYLKIMNTVTKGLEDVGLIEKGSTPANARGMLPIVYDTPLIHRSGGRTGEFLDDMTSGFLRINEAVKDFRGSEFFKEATGKIKEVEKKLTELKKKVGKQDALAKERKALKAEVESLKKKINDRADPLIKNSKGKVWDIMSREQIEVSAQQAVDEVLGNGTGSQISGITKKTYGETGGLKARKIMIPQAEMQRWHIKDVATIVDSQMRTMFPITNMTKRAKALGHNSIDEWHDSIIKGITEDYNKEMAGKPDTLKLNKKLQQAKADVTKSFDMVLGMNGQPLDPLGKSFAEFGRNIRGWNFLRLLGQMTIAALADVGGQVYMHGPFKAVYNGALPAFRQLAGLSPELKADRNAIGFGFETELGARLKHMVDGGSPSEYRGVFSRMTDRVTKAYGNITMMNPWNDIGQTIASSISIHRTLTAIDNIVAGKKVAKKEITRLARLGIHESNFKTIADKTAGMIDGPTSTRYAGWTNWEIGSTAEANALKQFQAATIQEVNATVLVPGLGSVPAWGQTHWGKSILQFKTFIFTANEKLLLAGIQRRGDADVWMGALTMTGLGAMSYIMTSHIRGQEPDLSFSNLAREGVDRSGILGIHMEGYNILNKIGVLPWGEVSRYKTRGPLGAMLGPTAGLTEDVAALLNRITQSSQGKGKPLSTKDTEMLLRLMPWQNLSYMYKLNRKVTNEIALSLGARQSR